MKKTYQICLALLAALLLGATNVSAEEISLQEVPFWQHEGGWGLSEAKATPAECAWVIGESSGQPYGDSNVNAFADLTGFDALIITFSEGSPRVLLNRDQDEGQWDANEANSHLIDNTKAGWSSKYFSTKDGVMTVDLKALVNDKGFAHLHAIKGANWSNMTVESIVVTRKGKEKQVGWVNILNNSDLEGDDLSSFRYVINGNGSDGNVTYDPVIEDGVGRDGSRGLAIKSSAEAAETWSTQLFVVLPEVQPLGTEWRFSMDVISNPDAEIAFGGHAEPRNWKCGGGDISSDFSRNFTSTSEWKTITAKGVISEKNVADGFKSIAFDLNLDKTTATQYYFDNVKFEVYKYGTVAMFDDEAIQIDFGFETNIPALCKAAGKSRVVLPKESAKVLINGEEATILSVEGFADGRFYIFMEDAIDEDAEVKVSFTNAEGDLQLKYAGGPNAGQAIPNVVDEIADHDDAVTEAENVFSYAMLPPSVVAAYPEQGSFNIKKDLKEFTVKFDKLAQADKIKAKLDGQALTVSPAEGLVEEIKLTYAGADMADGMHAIVINDIFPENDALELKTDTTYQFSVGAPDPTDIPFDLIPVSYFEGCAVNSVPEGFKLYADGDPAEERVPGGNYGSGARMMEFAAGGEFTRGLYMRTWYLTYGANDETHLLNMEAGKKYNISFNSCQWSGAGHYMKFQIMNGEQEVFSQVVENNPSLGEQRNAVKGSTFTSIDFTPEATANYVMNWIVAKDAEGTPTENAWQNGVILANVKVSYIPSTFGAVEMLAVREALEKAKKTQTDYADERYDGAAQTALNEAIAKVDAENGTYTSPSECYTAAELLNKASEDLKDHVALCNNYDQLIKDGSDVVRQHAEDKFAALEDYAKLVTVVNKYHGVSVMQNDGTEEEPNWQKHYTFDVLKEDAQLQAAITELDEIVNITKNMFTTGEPKIETTGVAALVERLRLGAETLKVLDPENPLIQQALNAIDDDDNMAEALKKTLKAVVYGKIKDDATGDFFKTTDPETLEETAKTYDMTVFVKNPNLYSPAYSEDVPGWEKVSGNAKAWSSWNGNINHGLKSQFVQDCALHPGWHAVASVEQEITDLPIGIYNIKVRGNDNSATSEGTYAYVKLSDTPVVEEGATFDKEANTAGYADVNNSGWDREINNIVVKDGHLTLGFAWGPESQAFFDDVHVLLAGKVNEANYNDLYNEAVTSIDEKVTTNVKVRAIELYDLNGRRVNQAQKGLLIMKQVMTDGTVRTIKVVK